jgi:hypothetical protein
VEQTYFTVGSREYELVIVPSCMTNFRSATYEMLLQYMNAGGQVVSLNAGDIRIDGRRDERAERLLSHPRWLRVGTHSELEDALAGRLTPRIEFQGQRGMLKGVTHMRRELADGTCIYFLVNSGTQEIGDSVLLQGAHAEQWNPWTGNAEPAAYEKEGDRLRMVVTLPPSGSLLLYVHAAQTRESSSSIESAADSVSDTACTVSELTILAEQENTFMIDYCDLKVGSGQYHEINTIHAGIKVFEKHGFAANPWDNGIQFGRRLLDRNGYYDQQSGFEASYHFDIIAGQLPARLTLIVERAELYGVQVNGKSVEAATLGSFLDHQTAQFDISSCIREGSNTVVLKASPFQVLHEIEAVYLKGDFGVWNVDGKWVIGKPAELSLGSWVTQGRPFYAGAVAYAKKMDVQADFSRATLTLKHWRGTVASVRVNGNKAGLIGAGTGESLDITEHLSAGWNDIEVRISGSFKNLLGPHHDPDKPRNLAWPPHWKKAPVYGRPPAEQYDFIDYGLFEDFSIHLR